MNESQSTHFTNQNLTSNLEELWDFIAVNVHHDESVLSAIRELVLLKQEEQRQTLGLRLPIRDGDVRGHYKILERVGRPSNRSHSAYFRAQCLLCNGIVFRYPNKMNNNHQGCTG